MFKFKPDNIYKKYNFLISKYVEAMRTNIIDYMEKDFNKLDKFFIKNEKYLPMEVQKYHHKLVNSLLLLLLFLLPPQLLKHYKMLSLV